nr:cytochrome P450 [uncultured bacterium]AXL05630.1 cytochrome P450 [uncultured bacterium]
MVRMDIGTMPVYMLNKPDLVHTILVTRAHSVHRTGTLFDRMREVVGNGLAAAEGDLHLTQRRLMQPALHRKQINGYITLMREHTQTIADSWQDGGIVDVDHAMADLIAGNAADAMFGQRLSPEMSGTIRRAMPVLTDNFMVRLQIPKVLERLPLPATRRFNGALAELRQVINTIVRQRLHSDTQHGNDLVGLLLAGQVELAQVHDEVVSVLLAGIVTTAPTLSWLFYELDRNPQVEARVLEELSTVLHDDVPLADSIGRLDYTRRAVREVLRLHPLLMVIRQVTSPFDLDGVALPAGTELGYSPYTLHRDPRLFPEPTRLDPDRWTDERSRHFPPGTFTPFGEGRHRCIGEFFAWAELLVALAVLLPRWRLRLAPGEVVRELNGGHPRPSSLRMTVSTR